MPKFLIQTHKFSGYYKNPFKMGGKGIKFTPWKTVAAVGNQQEAETMWEGLQAGRNVGQLEHFRVMYKGAVVVNHRGCVYEQIATDGKQTWGRFVKKLQGAEEL